jgi:hypothetical protein
MEEANRMAQSELVSWISYRSGDTLVTEPENSENKNLDYEAQGPRIHESLWSRVKQTCDLFLDAWIGEARDGKPVYLFWRADDYWMLTRISYYSPASGQIRSTRGVGRCYTLVLSDGQLKDLGGNPFVVFRSGWHDLVENYYRAKRFEAISVDFMDATYQYNAAARTSNAILPDEALANGGLFPWSKAQEMALEAHVRSCADRYMKQSSRPPTFAAWWPENGQIKPGLFQIVLQAQVARTLSGTLKQAEDWGKRFQKAVPPYSDDPPTARFSTKGSSIFIDLYDALVQCVRLTDKDPVNATIFMRAAADCAREMFQGIDAYLERGEVPPDVREDELKALSDELRQSEKFLRLHELEGAGAITTLQTGALASNSQGIKAGDASPSLLPGGKSRGFSALLTTFQGRKRWGLLAVSSFVAIVAVLAIALPRIAPLFHRSSTTTTNPKPVPSPPPDTATQSNIKQLEVEQSNQMKVRGRLEDQLDQAIAARTALKADQDLRDKPLNEKKRALQQQLNELAGKISTEQHAIDRLNKPVKTDSPEILRAKTNLAAAQATLRDLLNQKKQQQPGKKLNPDWEDIKQKRDSLQTAINQRATQITSLQKEINILQKEADDADAGGDISAPDKRREIREKTQQLSNLNLDQNADVAQRKVYDGQLNQTPQYLTDDTPSFLDQRIKTQQDIVAGAEQAVGDAQYQHPNSNMVNQDAIKEHEDTIHQLETERTAVAESLKHVDEQQPVPAATEDLKTKVARAEKAEKELKKQLAVQNGKLKAIKLKIALAKRGDAAVASGKQ